MSPEPSPTRRDRGLEPPAEVRAGLVRLGRLLAAHVYAGELAADGSFRETFAGPGLDDLLGTRVPHGEGHAAWLAAVHPDDLPTLEAMRSALRRGETVEAEYRLVGRDGVVRHVLDRMQPRAAPGGRVLVDGIVLDVSAGDAVGLPEAEEALYVLELHAGGAVALRAAGTGWPRVLGVDVGDDPDLIGDAWAAGVHPADVAGFLAARERLRGGEAVEVAYRLVGLDGQERVVVDRATPHAGEDDDTILAAGLVFDVTAEREARAELVETRERLETVLAAVAEVVFTEQVLDDGTAHGVFLGPGVAGVLGGNVRRQDLPATWDAAVHPDDRAAWARHRGEIAAARAADVELRLVGLDGRTRWVALRSRPRHDAAGRLLVDGIAADVTERREVADLSAERERRLRSLVDAIDDVVLTVELTPPATLAPVLVGRGLERLLGGPVPPRAEPIEIWRAALHPEDRGAFAAALAHLAALAPIDHVHRIVGLDGVVRSLEWHARPTPLEDGRVLVEGMLSDVSDHHQALHAIERAHADAEERSRVDVLTGLANRLRLEEALEAAPSTFAVVGLDVDHFKRINDTYGHGVGDEVLVQVAARLRDAVRASDLVARQGGEEFAVLLPHVPDDEVLTRIAEGLRRAIERPAFETAAGPLDVTASFGAARRTPASEGPPSAVAEAADAALYAAKRRGRNRVVLESALTAADLVAEEPAPIRLARALALAAGAATQGAGAADAAAVLAADLGLGPAEALAARAAAWLVGVDPEAARAVRELADLAPALEAWRAGAGGPDAAPVVRVLTALPLRPAA